MTITETLDREPELPAATVYPPAIKSVTSQAEACARFDTAVIPLAVDAAGSLYEWRPRKDPHLMVIGPRTTDPLNSMIACAAAQGLRIFILDFNAALSALRAHPGVVTVGTEPFEAVALVNTIYREAQQRYQQRKMNRLAIANAEPFLIVINDYFTFRSELQTFYQATKAPGGHKICPTITQLDSLLRLGRSSRFHFLAASESERLDGDREIWDNFTLRMSLGRLRAEAALMIHNDAKAGRNVPWDVPGRGTALNKYGIPTEVQALSLPLAGVESNREIQLLLDGLRPPNTLYERGVILPPPADPDSDPAEFTTYQNLPLLKVTEHPELDPLSPSYSPPAWLLDHHRAVRSLFGTRS